MTVAQSFFLIDFTLLLTLYTEVLLAVIGVYGDSHAQGFLSMILWQFCMWYWYSVVYLNSLEAKQLLQSFDFFSGLTYLTLLFLKAAYYSAVLPTNQGLLNHPTSKLKPADYTSPLCLTLLGDQLRGSSSLFPTLFYTWYIPPSSIHYIHRYIVSDSYCTLILMDYYEYCVYVQTWNWLDHSPIWCSFNFILGLIQSPDCVAGLTVSSLWALKARVLSRHPVSRPCIYKEP